jgi:hypothetical protein
MGFKCLSNCERPHVMINARFFQPGAACQTGPDLVLSTIYPWLYLNTSWKLIDKTVDFQNFLLFSETIIFHHRNFYRSTSACLYCESTFISICILFFWVPKRKNSSLMTTRSLGSNDFRINDVLYSSETVLLLTLVAALCSQGRTTATREAECV